MSEAKKLSQDNAFVSDLVLRQHVCPSRDNQNDQRQQKRQPTAVDPAEGKLRKITTQQLPERPPVRHLLSGVLLRGHGREALLAGMFIRYIFSLWYVVHWYIADAAMYQCRYLTRPAVLKVGTLYMAMYQLSWGNVRRARNLWKGTKESLEHGRS